MTNMLYEAILVGSRLFHDLEPRAAYYDQYFEDKHTELWKNAEAITPVEVERLILFLNQWASHYENSPAQRQKLLGAIRKISPIIEALDGFTLLTASLSEPAVRRDIACAFDTIASCGSRHEATAASKILHTIRPDLFVMWDSAIKLGYAVAGSAEDYGQRFLPRIQKLAWRAISEYSQAQDVPASVAVGALTGCGHTLAKVVDEYNYSKFTMRRDELWDAELKP